MKEPPEAPERPILVPHADHGDPLCCGIIVAVERHDGQAALTCCQRQWKNGSSANLMVITVPVGALERETAVIGFGAVEVLHDHTSAS